MRLTVALTLSLSLISAAFAFDGQRAAEEYYRLRPECRIGENAKGEALTTTQVEASCAEMNKIGKQLADNGFCYDNSEQEWASCKQ